jgi:hypothetical protein
MLDVVVVVVVVLQAAVLVVVVVVTVVVRSAFSPSRRFAVIRANSSGPSAKWKRMSERAWLSALSLARRRAACFNSASNAGSESARWTARSTFMRDLYPWIDSSDKIISVFIFFEIRHQF